MKAGHTRQEDFIGTLTSLPPGSHFGPFTPIGVRISTELIVQYSVIVSCYSTCYEYNLAKGYNCSYKTFLESISCSPTAELIARLIGEIETGRVKVCYQRTPRGDRRDGEVKIWCSCKSVSKITKLAPFFMQTRCVTTNRRRDPSSV